MGQIIGILDSGVGGLTVLSSLHKDSRVDASFLYFSDSAYSPYGDRDAQCVLHRVHSILRWMSTKGVQKVILACHTASSLMRHAGGIEFLNMVQPTVKSIMQSRLKRGVVVLCTALTSRQHALETALRQGGWTLPIVSVPCPHLSSLIEQCLWSEAVLLDKKYLSTVEGLFDGIVYGCTHYTLLAPYLPDSVKHLMIDPSQYVADFLFRGVRRTFPTASSKKRNSTVFYCTAKESFLERHWDLEGPAFYVSQKDLMHPTREKGATVV